MAYFTFEIPQSTKDLVEESENYYVQEIVPVKNLLQKLRDAKLCFRDDGPEFIFDTFDTFYSVFYHTGKVSGDIVSSAHSLLQSAVDSLNNNLTMILGENENPSEEARLKYCNVLKMLLYVYTNTVLYMEDANERERKNLNMFKGKGGKRVEKEVFVYDMCAVFSSLCNILDKNIHLFWDPPIVECKFIGIITHLCYQFLEYSIIKSKREARVELFCVLGTLVKSYDHGNSLVVRLSQLIKLHEHLVNCVPDGIQILVQRYNCKGLVHQFVKEMTEWQTSLTYQDNQGTRFCSLVLVEMAVLMPQLMIPEVMYLDSYLANDPYPLRNSILSVITEVILAVLTKHDLTDEERESRDDFLDILQDHIEDVSSLVRTKVFQHWSRLQTESAVPLKMLCDVLEKIVEHVWDKGALARKTAVGCVTQFLKCNPFGPKLDRKAAEKELTEKATEYENNKKSLYLNLVEKVKEMNALWITKETEVLKVLREKLESEDDVPESRLSKEKTTELVYKNVMEGKYADAVTVGLQRIKVDEEKFTQLKKIIEHEDDIEIYMLMLRTYFVDHSEAATEGVLDLQKMEEEIDYLNDQVKFLQVMDAAVAKMLDLLDSPVVTDLQEAAEFFVAAYQFELENAMEGVFRMLRVMQRNEPERRELVVNALKTVYLVTDKTNMGEHTKTIADRLVNLIRTIPVSNYDGLKLVIKQWVNVGDLDNGVIEKLWQYVTHKEPVTEEKSMAALQLVGVAGTGRETIVKRNIKLISTIGFGERGRSDMRMVRVACDVLSVLGKKSEEGVQPFRISWDDPLWEDLLGVLEANFFEVVPFFNKALSAGIHLIYVLCSKPDKICQELAERIVNSVADKANATEEKAVDSYVAIRWCVLIGEIALKQLTYLDDPVYKELKRRAQSMEEKKANKSKRKSDKRKSRTATEASRLMNSTLTADESTIMEGAQADDAEAEFILNILENETVTGNGGLAKFAALLKTLCTKQIYRDFQVQSAAVTAFCRYMLVSSKFCEENMQLIFTILEKTPYVEIKCIILVHSSDLLVRFPNIVEPWTPKIYQRLKDPSSEVRISAFSILSSLILRDMILAHGHMSEMAHCLIDSDETVKMMAHQFFKEMANKSNNLYCALPDIFSHLSDLEGLEQADLRGIIKFLFGLVDKTKQMEGLVDRFCSKFSQTDDENKCRNVAYCLTLIQYSEKGIMRLVDNFQLYKHLLHVSEIYTMFKQIIAANNKNKTNKVALELEEKIKEVFNTDENGEQRADVEKTPFKKPGKRAPKRAKTQKKNRVSDGSVVESPVSTSKKRGNKGNEAVATPSSRPTRTRRNLQASMDDSDSE